MRVIVYVSLKPDFSIRLSVKNPFNEQQILQHSLSSIAISQLFVASPPDGVNQPSSDSEPGSGNLVSESDPSCKTSSQ